MLNKYLVLKAAIHNIKGFHTIISAHFKQEMFLSWAIDQNHIKHDLLLGLCTFVVNHAFLLPEIIVSPFSHSSPLSRFKLANENTVIASFSSLNSLCSAKWNILLLILVVFLRRWVGGERDQVLFYGNHFTIDSHYNANLWRNWAWSPAWMYLAKQFNTSTCKWKHSTLQHRI